MWKPLCVLAVLATGFLVTPSLASCGGDCNAKSGCGLNCNKHCSNVFNGRGICPRIACPRNGCECKDGYYFDSNIKKCVLPDECSPICEENEIYSNCINNRNKMKNCSQLWEPKLTCDKTDRSKCIIGCICKKDYLRADNGTCIPKDQCQRSCGEDPNAESGCGLNCNKHCSNLITGSGICPRIACPPNGCECKDGYYFDEHVKKCVLPKQCTGICKVNEEYNECTNGGCQIKNCSQISKPIPCVKIDPAHCVKGCLCKDGYLRAENGTCIPAEKCESECKGPNEHFSCGSACDNVCSTLSKQNQTNCPNTNQKCKPMCYCDKDYARNEDGICIPIDQCGVSCHGDSNAITGCGIHCGRRCSSYKKGPAICHALCLQNACDCKQNYVYDDNIDKCVLFKDCTPSCKANETYDLCANSGCRKWKCSDPGVLCIDSIKCEGGCVCKDGYLQDKHGNCILEDECSTPADTTTNATPTKVNTTEALARLNKGSIALTGEFLYQLLTTNPNSNFVASATSVLIPLAQLAYFATGLVLEQLLKLLNLRNKDEIKKVFPGVIASYKTQSQIIFEVANKYYANINYPLSDKFKKFSLEVFDSAGENINFSKNVDTAKIINDWVEKRTHNKIKNLVTPDMFSDDTRLVLVNAIYYMGNWVHQFNPNDTKKRDFYLDNTKTTQLNIMYQKRSFKYCEDNDLQIQALEMPYKNSNFSFLVILPRAKGVEAVKTVAGKLKKPDVFTGILDKLSYQQVQVYLPRMLISTNLNIADILKKDNVTEIFKKDSNGFRGMLKREQPIYISDAVQKAFISVDETGTEAAAATAIGLTTLSLPVNRSPVYVFNANHPYLFYLKLDKMLLFCGAFLS